MMMMKRNVALAVTGIAASAALSLMAAPAAMAETTPYYQLQCSTYTGGSFGSYYGGATCTGAGLWKVQVDCTAGGTLYGPSVLSFGETRSTSAGTCWWGVNSVRVVEIPA
ncbi:hypothetical protein [Streptomyces sp. NPDC058701]|uniref:hypothetical protein n=1 Tax=Streptomyces sp. NPDC058701 TaxID=3346608 RepID=UPI003657AA76